MGILSGAIARPMEKTNVVHSPKGMYNGYFTGMSAPYEWQSPWQGDPCRGCNGTKKSTFNTDLPCSRCGGTGLRIEQHVKLYYHLETGVTEEEDVQFKISPPSQGKTKQGQVVAYSPSTLYLRLRELSGINNATPEQLDAWYDSLPHPISIPITLLIGDNQNQTALKITALNLRHASGGRPQQYAPATQQYAHPNPPQQYPPPFQNGAPRPPGGPNGAGPIPAQQFGNQIPTSVMYADAPVVDENGHPIDDLPF